jgi:hypothetical protein
MITELSPEATELGQHARRALEAAGGDTLVERAEADPARRAELVEPVLAPLGAWELDVRAGADELEAAAALCRSAGWWATPYPVAERLAAPSGTGVAGLVVVADDHPRAALAGMGGTWRTVALDGGTHDATAGTDPRPARKTGFVVPLELDGSADPASPEDIALGLVLPCCTLLGMLDRAIEATCAYAGDREQFGQPLSRFQGVQFQLTEAEVERAGLEVLAAYALWSIEAGRPEVVEDALALRVAALDAARIAFRVAHQVHGAIGFCDETPLSWLSRHSEPIRRLPHGPAGTLASLTDHLGRRGLAGLFTGEEARR